MRADLLVDRGTSSDFAGSTDERLLALTLASGAIAKTLSGAFLSGECDNEGHAVLNGDSHGWNEMVVMFA